MQVQQLLLQIVLVNVAGSIRQPFYDKAQALRRELGFQALLLTRSEAGMTIFQSDRSDSVSANVREVADVTGAGDTVIATIALLVTCGVDLCHAMSLANRTVVWLSLSLELHH